MLTKKNRLSINRQRSNTKKKRQRSNTNKQKRNSKIKRKFIKGGATNLPHETMEAGQPIIGTLPNSQDQTFKIGESRNWSSGFHKKKNQTHVNLNIILDQIKEFKSSSKSQLTNLEKKIDKFNELKTSKLLDLESLLGNIETKINIISDDAYHDRLREQIVQEHGEVPVVYGDPTTGTGQDTYGDPTTGTGQGRGFPGFTNEFLHNGNGFKPGPKKATLISKIYDLFELGKSDDEIIGMDINKQVTDIFVDSIRIRFNLEKDVFKLFESGKSDDEIIGIYRNKGFGVTPKFVNVIRTKFKLKKDVFDLFELGKSDDVIIGMYITNGFPASKNFVSTLRTKFEGDSSEV